MGTYHKIFLIEEAENGIFGLGDSLPTLSSVSSIVFLPVEVVSFWEKRVIDPS